MRPLLPLLLLLCALAASAPEAAASEPSSRARGPHLQAEFLSDRTAVRPGDVLQLGVRFRLDERWHLYWRQPGDSGLPPKLTFDLPPGFRASPIAWPLPRFHPVGPLAAYVYERDVLLPVRVQVPFQLDADQVALSVDVEWLVCEDDQGCIPGEARLTLTLPVTRQAALPSPDAPRFEQARARMPVAAPPAVSLRVQDSGPVVQIEGDGPWRADGAKLSVLWATFGVVDPLEPLEVQRGNDTITLRGPWLPGPTSRAYLEAVLVVETKDRRTGYLLRAGTPPKADEPAAASPTDEPEVADPATQASAGDDDLAWAASYVELADALGAPDDGLDRSLLGALLLAFLGGLILNIMPCVLPVLSLKILGFVDQAGGDRVRTRRHGYAFAAGVIGCFLLVAGILLGLRGAGNEIGWGFQLQEPAVVVSLAMLMFLLGLNLSGVFEIGTSLTGIAGRATSRVEGKGYMGSFGTGVLATVIATPCTAPFMGPAIGFALTQPAISALLVFAAMGVGMAAPYVLLAVFPRWLKFVPRPGPWMVTFKQVMAFPMFATVVWLVWVFGRQVGADGVGLLLIGLLLAAVGAWLFGRYGVPSRKAGTRWIVGHGLAAVVLAAGVWLSLRPEVPGGDGAAARVTTAPEGWVPYDGRVIRTAQEAGQPVFLDFTADWCLTCKANEAAFLDADAVRDAFRRHGVIAMQADWTRRDERITRALAALDRSSVPLYVIVPGDPERPAVVLRTAITTGYVVDALDLVLDAPPE